MKRSRRLQLIVCALFHFPLVACTTSHQSVPSTPTTRTQLDTARIDSRYKSWAPQLIAIKSRYFIHDSSTISINNDTTATVVPIESTMIYSISTADSNNLLILTGHVDSLSISNALSTKTKPDTGTRPNLHIVISKQGRFLNSSQMPPINCSTANAPSSSRIGELLIPLPHGAVKVGDKWTDTSSTISCHGKISLTHTTIREYELLDLSSCELTDAAKVRELVTDSLTGSSAENNNHLSASGFGTASSTLCLGRSTGTLLERNGQSRLELTVTTSRGVFPFTQNSHTHIKLR